MAIRHMVRLWNHDRTFKTALFLPPFCTSAEFVLLGALATFYSIYNTVLLCLHILIN